MGTHGSTMLTAPLKLGWEEDETSDGIPLWTTSPDVNAVRSIGSMSGLRAGQSMTSTSCWSKTAAMSRAVWGGALSWTYTKLRLNTPVAHGNIWFLRIWMYRRRFMTPSTTTSSLLPQWWIVPHTMTDGPRFSSLGWTQASISLSPCLRRTRTRPSLWYMENRDSSLKIQCLHCPRSTLCASSRTHGGVACAPKWV